MADRTFEVNITTAVQAPYAIKNAGYAGEHNATAIQINLPADYIGGFTYSLDLKTGGGEAYPYPLVLGEGDDFLYFEISHPLSDKGALDFQLKVTETATGMVVKTRGVNLQFIGRDIHTYAELAEDYVPDTTATEDCLNAAALANLKAGLVQDVIDEAEGVIADTALATTAMQETVGAAVSQAESDISDTISQAEGDIAAAIVQAESDIDDTIGAALEEVDTVKAAVFVDKGYGEMYMYDNANVANIETANVYHAILSSFGNNDGNLAPTIDTNIFTYKAGLYAAIASVANYNSPTNTKIEITCTAPHTFLAGEPITITGTTNYNGMYLVQSEGITSTKFVVLATYVSTQTGDARRGATLKVAYAGKYKLDFTVSGSCESANDVFKFELNKDITPLDNICARSIWDTGTNYRSAGAGGITTLTAGQYIWLSAKNYSGANDLTIRSANVSILKLTDNTVDGSTLTIVEAIADAQDATAYVQQAIADAEQITAIAQDAADAADIASYGVLDITARLDGVVLPVNKALNTGRLTGQNVLPNTSETTAVPKIERVADTDSPMTGKMDYKTEISETTAHTTNLFKDDVLAGITGDVTSICIGYWIKDSEVTTIFSTNRNIVYWLYTTAGLITLSFYIGDLISEIGKTVTVTSGGDANMIATHTPSVVCMAKSGGYSYVKLYITGITWKAGFTDFTHIKLYHYFNSVRTYFANQKLTIQNLTILFNDYVTSPYYIYPDGVLVEQYPPVIGMLANIETNADDIDTNAADIDAAERGILALETYIFGTVLDTNQVYAAGKSSGQNILSAQSENAAAPKIERVADEDSPMAGKLTYKTEISVTTQHATSIYVTNTLPELSAETTSISVGYWTKDTEISTIFSTTRNMVYWFYNAAGYITVSFAIGDLISAENKTVAATVAIVDSGLIDSCTTEAICLAKEAGYSFVRLTLTNIVWTTGFSDFTNVVLYHHHNSVREYFVDTKYTLQNLTILYNDTIANAYYVYPDGLSVEQYPSVGGIVGDMAEDASGTYPITVELDSSQVTKDLAIRTTGNDTYDIINLFDYNKQTSLNDIVSIYNTGVLAKATLSPWAPTSIVGGGGDDSAPINLNGSYIAGGHGQNSVAVVTKTAHGKTFADISSEWTDGVVSWFLIKVVSTSVLWFLPEPTFTGDIYSFPAAITGTTLTHVTGATNTSTITDLTKVTGQLTPATVNQTRSIYLDGDTSVTANGSYGANEYVDVCNEYDIINPAKVVDYLIANKGAGYIANPDLNVGEALLHYSVTHRVLRDGTTVLFSELTPYKNVNLGYWGVIQEGAPVGASMGGAWYKYIPKALPRTYGANTYEFRTPRDMTAALADAITLSTEYWEDENNPPDRYIDLLTNAEAVYTAGFAIGYLPIAYGAASIRTSLLNDALSLYTTKKTYPKLINIGTPLAADTTVQAIAYRKLYLMDDTKSGATSFYIVPVNGKYYVYLDYHSVIDDSVILPKETMGKTITVLEKSSNVTVYGSIATGRLRVKVETASPLYGYAVLELS